MIPTNFTAMIQNKTQKQSNEKEHNKQIRVYRAGIKLYGHLFIQHSHKNLI